MSFSSPISAVDCAPVNPLSALAGHLTAASSSLVPGNVAQAQKLPLRPSQPLVDAHLHARHSRPPAGPAASASGLVDQFQALALQQQQHEREMRHLSAIHSAIVQPPPQMAAAPAAQWLSEFDARAATAQPPPGLAMSLPPHQLQHAHQLPHQHQHPAMFHRPPLYQPAPFMMPQMHFQPARPLLAPPPVMSATQLQTPRADENIMAEVYGQQADAAGSFQQGVASVHEPAQFVDSFTSGDQVQSGFGGGLNGEMIERLMASDDPKWRNSKFLKFISKIKEGKIEFRNNEAVEREAEPQGAEDWATEFQQSNFPTGWSEDFEQREGLRPLASSEDIANMAAGWSRPINADAADEATWNEEFRELVQGAAEPLTDEEKQWSDSFAASSGFDLNWSQALEQMQQAQPQSQSDPEYVFHARPNSYLSSQSSPFEEGMRLLAAGQLNEAILAFEATVQLDPSHSEAWCQLGAAQAENENEREAIAALLKAVSLDPYNIQALLQLGVSYTNDLEESRALNYLATWLESNPDYQSETILAAKNSIDEYSQFYGSGAGHSHLDAGLHGQVTAMFKEALRLRPADSQLHTVLGVLYHLSSDFDQSIECFKTALKLSPDSAQLWNKLGATLANSSRSGEAVHAYHRALQLRPRYVRALANLAISYANQNAHESACVYYLKCLQCNDQPDHIWSYLRISLAQLGKDELVELTHRRNVQLFKAHYDF